MFKDPKGDPPKLVVYIVILIIVVFIIIAALALLGPAVGNIYTDPNWNNL